MEKPEDAVQWAEANAGLRFRIDRGGTPAGPPSEARLVGYLKEDETFWLIFEFADGWKVRQHHDYHPAVCFFIPIKGVAGGWFVGFNDIIGPVCGDGGILGRYDAVEIVPESPHLDRAAAARYAGVDVAEFAKIIDESEES